MSKSEQSFEDAWSEGEPPAGAEHAKKKQAADEAMTAEAAEFAASWKDLKDE